MLDVLASIQLKLGFISYL